MEEFAEKLKQQAWDNEQLLQEVNQLKNRQSEVSQQQEVSAGVAVRKSESLNPVDGQVPVSDSPVVIPILMFACNRPTVRKALDPLLEYRGQDPERIKKFPIIVSQVLLRCS